MVAGTVTAEAAEFDGGDFDAESEFQDESATDSFGGPPDVSNEGDETQPEDLEDDKDEEDDK